MARRVGDLSLTGVLLMSMATTAHADDDTKPAAEAVAPSPTAASPTSAPPAQTAAPQEDAGSAVGAAAPVAPPETPKISEQQHRGFFFRADLGAGWMQSSGTVPNASLTISGFAGSFALAIGGAVTDNLIVAGEVWTQGATAPQISVNGVSNSTSSDVSLNLAALGPNITYYVMPANIYASVTPSLARLSIRDESDRTVGSTALGFATRLVIGKEWWVARHLGIGVGADLSIAFNKDEITIGPTKSEFYWTTLFGGLVLVGTYN